MSTPLHSSVACPDSDVSLGAPSSIRPLRARVAKSRGTQFGSPEGPNSVGPGGPGRAGPQAANAGQSVIDDVLAPALLRLALGDPVVHEGAHSACTASSQSRSLAHLSALLAALERGDDVPQAGPEHAARGSLRAARGACVPRRSSFRRARSRTAAGRIRGGRPGRRVRCRCRSAGCGPAFRRAPPRPALTCPCSGDRSRVARPGLLGHARDRHPRVALLEQQPPGGIEDRGVDVLVQGTPGRPAPVPDRSLGLRSRVRIAASLADAVPRRHEFGVLGLFIFRSLLVALRYRIVTESQAYPEGDKAMNKLKRKQASIRGNGHPSRPAQHRSGRRARPDAGRRGVAAPQDLPGRGGGGQGNRLRGRAGRGVRPARAKRRRQVDDDRDADDHGRAHRGQRPARPATTWPPSRCSRAASAASSSRTPSSTAPSAAAPTSSCTPACGACRADAGRSAASASWSRRSASSELIDRPVVELQRRPAAAARDRPRAGLAPAGPVPRRADRRASTRGSGTSCST